MYVRVENCWAGGDNYFFRCTLPDGTRFNVGHNTNGDPWCRAFAIEMRDKIVANYNIKRDSIHIL